MKRNLLAVSLCCLLAGLAVSRAYAFCGFYVARADTKLFNQASKVVLVRDGNRTVLTMANDYQGELKEFAIVIPVPTVLEKEQIHVANPALIDHLDAYSAPRLVEYYDEDPCQVEMYERMAAAPMAGGKGASQTAREKSLGVKIEAQYQVGEYDILILSAEQSGGLETWLKENDYRVPDGASHVLEGYIKQNMKFFVAKVNLEKQSKLGFSFLRPIQVAYESPKFMLPIRLGMVNANGPQELFVFALTKNGRVETTNYRTVKLPEGMDIPLYVKDEFPEFYRAMFSEQVKKEDMHAVFLEYAWDMGWCDPCAAEPLSNSELKELGVFWLEDTAPQPFTGKGFRPRWPVPPTSGANVFISRLHLRYDNDHFPDDLFFQETGDRTNFQGRYVLRHPWTGTASCEQAKQYLEKLPERQNTEAETLASLTGWDVEEIRNKMHLKTEGSSSSGDKWWRKLWPSEKK